MLRGILSEDGIGPLHRNAEIPNSSSPGYVLDPSKEQNAKDVCQDEATTFVKHYKPKTGTNVCGTTFSHCKRLDLKTGQSECAACGGCDVSTTYKCGLCEPGYALHPSNGICYEMLVEESDGKYMVNNAAFRTACGDSKARVEKFFPKCKQIGFDDLVHEEQQHKNEKAFFTDQNCTAFAWDIYHCVDCVSRYFIDRDKDLYALDRCVDYYSFFQSTIVASNGTDSPLTGATFCKDTPAKQKTKVTPQTGKVFFPNCKEIAIDGDNATAAALFKACEHYGCGDQCDSSIFYCKVLHLHVQ